MTAGGGATVGGPTRPRAILRAEGAAVAAGAIGAYVLRDASLLLFVGLVLLPDVSIGAYLVSPRVGATVYNVVHTYVGPAVLLAAGVGWSTPLAVDGGLVWAGHIGVDRLFGFGLKYAEREFGETHVQQV